MTKSNLEYQVKNAGYHLGKAIDTDKAHWAVTLAAGLTLPIMAFNGAIFSDDIDTTGNANAETVMAELSEQKTDLLAQVAQYEAIQAQQDAYEKLGEQEKSFDLADDLMRQEYKLRDVSHDFFSKLLTTGDQDGLAISETDAQELLTNLNQQSDGMDWEEIDERIPNIFLSANDAEHFDEMRANISIDKDDNLQTRFDKASTVAVSAINDDNSDEEGMVLGTLFGLLGGALTAFLMLVLRDNIYPRRPERPQRKPSH